MLCGQNVSDHNFHLEQLRTQLTEVTPLVVRLQPSHCQILADMKRTFVESIFSIILQIQMDNLSNDISTLTFCTVLF